jgi:hypothetical protein
VATSPTESSAFESATGRFGAAIARIDEANGRDPRHELYDGLQQPREWVYSRRMSGWLDRLEPDASEALRLAARAQHLRRWELERRSYPEGRTGYLRWRRDCAEMHARLLGELLCEVGYDEQTVKRAQSLVKKADRQHDSEAQTLEDVACLVFLEHHLEELASQTGDEKMSGILAKTWRKMSPRARRAALDLALPAGLSELLDRSLSTGVGPRRGGVE